MLRTEIIKWFLDHMFHDSVLEPDLNASKVWEITARAQCLYDSNMSCTLDAVLKALKEAND